LPERDRYFVKNDSCYKRKTYKSPTLYISAAELAAAAACLCNSFLNFPKIINCFFVVLAIIKSVSSLPRRILGLASKLYLSDKLPWPKNTTLTQKAESGVPCYSFILHRSEQPHLLFICRLTIAGIGIIYNKNTHCYSSGGTQQPF
jgi:hypothetical protein